MKEEKFEKDQISKENLREIIVCQVWWYPL